MQRPWKRKGLFRMLLLLIVFLAHATEVTRAIRIIPSSRNSYRVLEEDNEDIYHNDINDNNNTTFQRERKQRTSAKVDVAEHPDDHLVKSLPLLADDEFKTPHWAGLLPASGQGDKYFFYWLFGPDTGDAVIDDSIPLIIWLNGGPGCSSMDGLFIENGPFRFVLKNPDDHTSYWKLSLNEFSWHKIPAYVVYIDQPVGTGLSFTTSRSYPSNDELVNADFYYFFKEFLNLHSDKFLNEPDNNQVRVPKRPIYFSGESHSGHYIPSMMAYILKQNDKINNNSKKKMLIELAGAAIGNGWMDPIHQYAAATAAYGHGIIGRSQLAALNEKELKCQQLLKQKRYANNVCYDLLDDVVHQSHGTGGDYKISQYDVRKIEPKQKPRTFPVGHKVVEAYLGGRSTGSDGGRVQSGTFHAVLEAIHATASRDAGQNYMECTDPPYDALSHQDGLGVVDDVVYLLEHPTQRVRLLFFNGIEDLICNHVGNEVFLENMVWKHQREYVKSHRYGWKSPNEKVPGKVNGYMKQYNNQLLFLKLLDSGHMVPMDLPNVALSMMKTFMNDREGTSTSFEKYEQKLDTIVPPSSANCPVCNGDCGNGAASSYNAGLLAPQVAAPRIIAYTWIGAFVMIGVIVLVLVYNRRRVGRSFFFPAYPTATQYDLELRDATGGSYRDNEITASDVETDDHMGDRSDDSSENPHHFPPSNGYKK